MEPNESREEICPICYTPILKEELIRLECSHSFNKKCLFTYWKTSLLAGSLDLKSLKCPMEKCLKPMNLLYLKQYLTAEEYLKIEEQCNKNSEVINKDEKAVFCIKCELRFNTWKEAEWFTCYKCKIQYCSQCFAEYEKHKKLTCKQYAKLRDLNEEDQLFEKVMIEKGYKKCPVCFAFIERESGCNFVKCPSLKCNKKTCFCFLCEEIINASEHYTHYIESPWEGPCINQIEEGIKKKKINEENENEKENDDNDTDQEDEDSKDIENAVLCPKCNIFDEKICRFESNFPDKWKFCNCKSKVCNGTIYCLQCKNAVTDKNYDNHIKGVCDKQCIIF